MIQLTLRIPPRLARELRDEAANRGESVNAYAGRVLAAAVDPDLSGSDAERLRERLARAGLLAAAVTPLVPAPDPSALAAARSAAGAGTPLSDLISEGRS